MQLNLTGSHDEIMTRTRIIQDKDPVQNNENNDRDISNHFRARGKDLHILKDKPQQKEILPHFCHHVSIWEKLIITSGQMVEVVLF